MHWYPEGAIQANTDIKVGDFVYAGWGYGKVQQYFVYEGFQTSEYGAPIFPALIICGGHIVKGSVYLRDLNIGAHYNNHYLFRTREAAQAYVESL